MYEVVYQKRVCYPIWPQEAFDHSMEQLGNLGWIERVNVGFGFMVTSR